VIHEQIKTALIADDRRELVLGMDEVEQRWRAQLWSHNGPRGAREPMRGFVRSDQRTAKPGDPGEMMGWIVENEMPQGMYAFGDSPDDALAALDAKVARVNLID